LNYQARGPCPDYAREILSGLPIGRHTGIVRYGSKFWNRSRAAGYVKRLAAGKCMFGAAILRRSYYEKKRNDSPGAVDTSLDRNFNTDGGMVVSPLNALEITNN